MSTPKMHADELHIDVVLVRRLLEAQFPDWADLSIDAVPSAGTEYALFRLGDGMCARLPRKEGKTEQVEKEQRWLPVLAQQLPLAIPVPLAKGVPGEGYPWPWSVYRWLEGEEAQPDRIADLDQAARSLAEFVVAMRGIDPTDGLPAGEHNFYRGTPLAWRDEIVRKCIDETSDLIDTDLATEIWDVTLDLAQWEQPPVWVHGDIHSANLLAVDGRITAVIDFGGLGIGDPAVDMIVAWNLLTGVSRETFRIATGVDDATWLRGRGWALSIALIALPYYLHTNPYQVEMSCKVIAEVLAG